MRGSSPAERETADGLHGVFGEHGDDACVKNRIWLTESAGKCQSRCSGCLGEGEDTLVCWEWGLSPRGPSKCVARQGKRKNRVSSSWSIFFTFCDKTIRHKLHLNVVKRSLYIPIPLEGKNKHGQQQNPKKPSRVGHDSDLLIYRLGQLGQKMGICEL